MVLPPVEQSAILKAINEFEAILLCTDEWRDWKSDSAQFWALRHEGRLYPPKKIISIATGLNVNEFAGGSETNRYLNERGFEVIRLHQSTLDSIFKLILERYDDARRSTRFAGCHEIKELFIEARSILESSSLVKAHPNIRVVASYGKGTWASIPWISLLDKRETTTTQAGIYIVYLFERGGKGLYLKLAQGVIEAQREFGSQAEEFLEKRAEKIRVQCARLSTYGFDLSGKTNLHADSKLGRLYEASTIAARHYAFDSMPAESELLDNLSGLLGVYDAYVAN